MRASEPSNVDDIEGLARIIGQSFLIPIRPAFIQYTILKSSAYPKWTVEKTRNKTKKTTQHHFPFILQLYPHHSSKLTHNCYRAVFRVRDSGSKACQHLLRESS